MKRHEEYCENDTTEPKNDPLPAYDDEDGNSWIMKAHEERCEKDN